MPSLDQVLAQPPPGPGDLQVLEGDLVVRNGERYARIDGDAALWGPLVAADELADGDTVLIAVSQEGRLWAIASTGG